MVLMILVVLYHSIIFRSGLQSSLVTDDINSYIDIFANWLNSFHIYGFTLISGYIFYHIKYEGGGYKSYKEFIKKKERRLLKPYVFCSLFWAIPINIYVFRYDLKTIFVKFFLVKGANQLWFLIMLFGVFIIFWPISNYVKKYNFVGLFFVLVLYFMGFLINIISLDYFQISNIMKFVFFFWMGFKLRQYSDNFFLKFPTILYILLDIFLFVLAYMISNTNIFYKFLSVLITLMLNSIGALMSFLILQIVASKIKWREIKFFYILSEFSMIIFLFHQQIIYLISQHKVGNFFNIIINFVFSIILSILLGMMIKKYRSIRYILHSE